MPKLKLLALLASLSATHSIAAIAARPPQLAKVDRQAVGTKDPSQTNTRPIAGESMATQTEWARSSFPASRLGGYWRHSAFAGWVFNKEWSLTNTDSATGAPASSLLSVGYANGTPKDVVANMSVAIANSNGSSLFGFNSIATSTGHKTAIFRGGEIDVEPTATDVPLPGSAGLYLNVFNKPILGAAIQTGQLSGGSWSNGFACGGISAQGSCLVAAGGSSTMASLVNTSTGTFSKGAIIIGAGNSQGIGLGTSGRGVSPYVYGDASNNAIVQLGRGGAFIVTAASDSSRRFVVSNDGTVSLAAALRLPKSTVAALPRCGPPDEGALTAVIDASSSAFNAVVSGGGTNHVLAYCNGTRWTVH